MIVFPAIDLKDGAAVRLRQGEMNSATVFNADPADQARQFHGAGFEWLHVVDLNGAFEGHPVNRDTVAAIVEAVDLRIQLGGGIRDLKTIETWLSAGITRVILGTVAVKDPDLVKEACRNFPGRVVVGIDARGGQVAVEGWAEVSEMQATDLARSFEDAGVAAIVYTDIDRDGLLQGANVPATAALAQSISIPVIASGGVASLDDIAALQAVEESGIEGVICGRALYDGRIDPAAALALTSASTKA
ncbi:1-(5-phosphoribosyl)-5-[(5-phosphoribosylamino)methylideneamino]imidazole-4-carboxamide isomerase [Pelagibius sp. Alg239-R121]|uniref:1-(5-phosphoribosyl)-5-[(5- phosphoribosylamino)methylideneamino]imidazole-4- carboxamide isomerase n=1 Tax=Pelagibius sp. Alg239-R121 TaxID=2993448 RepID=UPI0024A62E84|nr:1-(5-phosphoribosyl)-5-[(5-phosphoribosylamino)methylideneamino]imidazole-4-carboxamide isomerase [Pelagibius sp. Alg239-R121]